MVLGGGTKGKIEGMEVGVLSGGKVKRGGEV